MDFECFLNFNCFIHFRTFIYFFSQLLTIDLDRYLAVRDIMAFAVHVNMERCTGCNNCVVACPVDALELNTVDPVTTDKIYQVINGKAVILDVESELCAGCGICVLACPYDVIKIEGRWGPHTVSGEA